MATLIHRTEKYAIDSATQFTAQVAIAETDVTDGNYRWWLKGFDTTPTPDEGYTLAIGSFIVAKSGLQATS